MESLRLSRDSVRLQLFCLGWVALLIIPALAWGSTINVNPGDLIADALAAAAAGDTVLVQNGIYQEQGLVLPAGVTLRSASGKATGATLATVGGESILICEDLAELSRVEGFTFTVASGGQTTPVDRGAGMLIHNASLFVSECRFNGLQAAYGGAVYCGDGALPFFSHCAFNDNTALAVGGAMNCVGSAAPVLFATLLAGNSAGKNGQAINSARGATPRLISCTVADNGSDADGGASLSSWDGSAAEVSRSIVVGLDGSAAWSGDAGAVPEISCSNIDNWGGSLAGQATQDGNLSADPVFCGEFVTEQPYSLDQVSPCTAAATGGCGLIGAFDVGCAVAGIGENPPGGEVAHLTRLQDSYPNPFNPSTTIRFSLARAGTAELAIYDVAGRLIKTLIRGRLKAGPHEVQWHGVDRRDRPCATGVYFVRLKAGTERDTHRVSLIK